MPDVENVALPLAGITLTDAATGNQLDLGHLDGVHVIVLMRHRH